MNGKKKTEYMEARIVSLASENKSLKAENKVLTEELEYIRKQLEQKDAAIETLVRNFERSEAEYAEEIEKAHELALHYESAKNDLLALSKKYKAEYKELLRMMRKPI